MVLAPRRKPKNMKKVKLIALLTALMALPLFAASEYGISWTYASRHQTDNTTWTPSSSTVRINTLMMNVSNAGTTWIITVKNKEGTPKILYTATVTVGNTTILALPVGIEMASGIDVTFSGTAGTADLFAVYR
jgi:hypothetical protein